ncbi:MAG: phosphatidate cytidylyltransferase [Bacteroidetes bacterium]|nr:phosphatidate cytidylyltransferase [Bacteroidota bacterium]
MDINIKSNLYKRFVVAILGISLFLFMIIFDKWTFFCFFLGLKILILLEFYNIVSLKNKILLIPSLTFSISSYIISFLFCSDLVRDYQILSFFILFPYIIIILALFQEKVKNSFLNLSYSIMGIIYITIPFCLVNLISFSNYNYDYTSIIFLFLIIWANDSGAFFIGKLFGKNKLFKRISPNKTWEGAIGGILFSLILSFLLKQFPIFQIKMWYLTSFVISITSVLGDLVASSLKRNFNIKDSGNFLPGHGGLLDRFDSFLISIPFFVILQYLIIF